jgi:predicted amino acid racemase
MESVLYGDDARSIFDKRTAIRRISKENIDYYGCVDRKEDMKIGDTAIYAFRAQIFVTRAHIAFVKGVDTGLPEVVYFQRRGM